MQVQNDALRKSGIKVAISEQLGRLQAQSRTQEEGLERLKAAEDPSNQLPAPSIITPTPIVSQPIVPIPSTDTTQAAYTEFAPKPEG